MEPSEENCAGPSAERRRPAPAPPPHRPLTPPNQQVLPPEPSGDVARFVRRSSRHGVASVVIPAKPGQHSRQKDGKGSLRERNSALLFSELMSDITFLVGSDDEDSDPELIPAHTFILASASQVFYAMFYSGFEKKESVRVPDVGASSFRGMLRYLYTDEVELGPGSVLGLLYCGKKYLVGALTEACVAFLDSTICASNVCLLLSQADLFGEPDLVEKCWEALDADAEAALESPGFLDLDAGTMGAILARDSLKARESVVFEAAAAWGRAEAARRKLGEGSDAVRVALGEAFYDIRLPTMTPADFADGPARSTLLKDSETRSLFLWLVGKRSELPIPRWSSRLRSGLPLRRAERFLSSAFRCNQWRYRGRCDSVQFSVDRRVWVGGLGLYGSSTGPGEYQVSLELKEGAAVLAATSVALVTDGSSEVFPVHFPRAVQVEADRWYTASAVLEGPSMSYFGQEGQTELSVGRLTWQFQASTESTNGTGVQGGQIPEILFYSADS